MNEEVWTDVTALTLLRLTRTELPWECRASTSGGIVSAHGQTVAEALTEVERELRALTDESSLRERLEWVTAWAARARHAMGRVAPDAPRFHMLEDEWEEWEMTRRVSGGAP